VNEQVWWYLSRATGIVAWVLITLSVLWGLTLSTRVLGRTAPPAWLLDLHRHLGAMSIVFTGLHIGALVGDNYVHFGWADLFVPFASGYKTVPVAWGVIGFWMLVAVEVSSLMKRRLPNSAWRWVHRSSWGLFVLVTVHGLQAGTDVKNPAYRWVAIASIQLVLFLTLVRIIAQRRVGQRASVRPVAEDDAEKVAVGS
jgi:predicted ferric reductase